MGNIFLSYRRDDARASAERIYDRLAVHFGPQQVFRDVTSIPTGDEFRTAVDGAIARSTVVLVVIGRHWTSLKSGRRKRLSLTSDPVRLEILTALKYGILVIPVLVEDAKIPSRRQLPFEIRQLADRQAKALHFDPDFEVDVDQLIQQIEAYQQQHPTSPADRPQEFAEQRRLIAAAQDEDRRVLRRRRFKEIVAITMALLLLATSLGIVNLRTGFLFSFTRVITQVVTQHCDAELEVQPFLITVTLASDSSALRSHAPAAEAQFAGQLRGVLAPHASQAAGRVKVYGGASSTSVDYGVALAGGAIGAMRLLANQGFVFTPTRTVYEAYSETDLSNSQVRLEIYFFTPEVCTSSH